MNYRTLLGVLLLIIHLSLTGYSQGFEEPVDGGYASQCYLDGGFPAVTTNQETACAGGEGEGTFTYTVHGFVQKGTPQERANGTSVIDPFSLTGTEMPCSKKPTQWFTKGTDNIFGWKWIAAHVGYFVSGESGARVDKGQELFFGCYFQGTSPTVLSLDDSQVRFSSPEDGMLFNLDGTGLKRWSRPLNGAFLALDRNQNRQIDDGTEVFGNFTEQAPPDPSSPTEPANGFRALQLLNTYQLDESDGHGPRLTPADARWSELLVCPVPSGSSGPWPVSSCGKLSDHDITFLGLDYIAIGRQDRYGIAFRFGSHLGTAHGQRPYFDVFFPPQP